MTHSDSAKSLQEVEGAGGAERPSVGAVKESAETKKMRENLTPRSLELEKRLTPITPNDIDALQLYSARTSVRIDRKQYLFTYSLPKDPIRICELLEYSTIESMFIDLQSTAALMDGGEGATGLQTCSLNGFWQDQNTYIKNLVKAVNEKIALRNALSSHMCNFLDFNLQPQLSRSEYYATFPYEAATNLLANAGVQYGVTIMYDEFLTKCLLPLITRAFFCDLDKGDVEIIEQFNDVKLIQYFRLCRELIEVIGKTFSASVTLSLKKSFSYYEDKIMNHERGRAILSVIYNSAMWDEIYKNSKGEISEAFQAIDKSIETPEEREFFDGTKLFKLYKKMLSEAKIDTIDSDLKPFFAKIDSASIMCSTEDRLKLDAAYKAEFRHTDKFKFKNFVFHLINPENKYSSEVIQAFIEYCQKSKELIPAELPRHFKDVGYVLPGQHKSIVNPSAKKQTVKPEAVVVEASVPPAKAEKSHNWFRVSKTVDETGGVSAPRSAYDPLLPKAKKEKGKKKDEAGLPEDQRPTPVLPLKKPEVVNDIAPAGSSSSKVVSTPAPHKPLDKSELKHKARQLQQFVNQGGMRLLRAFAPKERVKAHSLEAGTVFEPGSLSYAAVLTESSHAKAEKKRIKTLKENELQDINEKYTALSNPEYDKWMQARQNETDARMWIDLFFDAVLQLNKEAANKGTIEASSKFGLNAELYKRLFDELQHQPAEILDIYAKKIFDFMVLPHEHHTAPQETMVSLFGSDHHPARNYIAGRFCEMSGLKHYAEIWHLLTTRELRVVGMKHLEAFNAKGEIREVARLNCIVYLVSTEHQKLLGLYNAIQMSKGKLLNTEYLHAINLYVIGLIELLQVACTRWEHAGNNPDVMHVLRLSVDAVMSECRICIANLLQEFDKTDLLFVSERQMHMIFKNLSVLTDALRMQELKDAGYTYDLMSCDTSLFFSQMGLIARQPQFESNPNAFCEMVKSTLDQRRACLK